MDWVCGPCGPLTGDIQVPGDKSVSHRALMLGAIAEGTTRITGFLEGADCLATLSAMRAMGVEIEQPGNGEVIVHGRGLHGLQRPSEPLDVGNAGTAMRLMTGLLAGQAFDSVLVGDESLMRRPMNRVAKPLGTMGAAIGTQDGLPPVRISGGQALTCIDYTMPVASAQVKSALLLAGLYANGEVRIVEPAPCRDHTERMLTQFGCAVQRDGLTVRMQPPERLVARDVLVPGDFSSAAFFMVAASLRPGSDLMIRNVGLNPTRTGLLDMLIEMGANITVFEKLPAAEEPTADIQVRGTRLRGIDVAERLVPLAIDEFPSLFAAAACATGTTTVTGARELRVKESDRIGAMADALSALGVPAQPSDDGLRVSSGIPTGGTVDSRGDHRIAMAMAVLAGNASGPVTIRDVANVGTSFPGFANLARSVGMDVEASKVSADR
ncbi:MAG: 3-phosphoshikimate 1-carboxyvinyltransferase [Pseudomonadota bacterium]